MKLIIFTTGLTFFMVFILPGLLSLGIRYIPGSDQPSLDRSEKIFFGQNISQEFTSPKESLTGIGLSLKNPNLANKRDIILNLEDDKGSTISASVLNGAHIQDGKFVKFIFNPIVDSKNKNYRFVLSSPKSSAVDSLEVFYTVSKIPNADKFMIAERVSTESAISFVTFHKPERVVLLAEIYGGWIDRLIKDSGFFVIYILILAGLSGYLIFNHNGFRV